MRKNLPNFAQNQFIRHLFPAHKNFEAHLSDFMLMSTLTFAHSQQAYFARFNFRAPFMRENSEFNLE